MGDYFCCVCRTFTWQSARYLHLKCGSAENLVKDQGSWGTLLIFEKDDETKCSACNMLLTADCAEGHYRICPACFETKLYLK